MVANDPPVIHIARAASSTPAGSVQVHQLPATQILSVQDGGNVPGANETMNSQTFPCNRVCEFKGDTYIVRGTAKNTTDGVFKRNKGGDGNWGQVWAPQAGHLILSGLVVVNVGGIPRMVYQYYEPDLANVPAGDADGHIAWTSDGENWSMRHIRSVGSGDQPLSSGEIVAYRNSVFWAHSPEDPGGATTTGRVITSHDIATNLTTIYSVFDKLLSTGCEVSLAVHKNKLFAFGIRDNNAAADGNRYELRRLFINGSSGFGSLNASIHVESDAGGGQYPGALSRSHAAMFTDPVSGQLIIITGGGPSTGTTVAPVGGAKVLRFATADTDIPGANAGVDISSIVMGDLGNPTGAGGADRYLLGGSTSVLNKVWYVVVDNQTVPGAPARVFLWVAQLSTYTECWEWKGINAEMELVANGVGIRLNEYSLPVVTAGGGQYYPRIAAVELEGIPEEVAGGTKFEFRGEGESAAGVVTFYSDTEEEAPTTEVPIVGSLVVGAGMLTSLEAYYQFESGAGDSSTNGLNLSTTGTVPVTGTGIFGNGADFPGTAGNYFARAGDDATLDIGGAPFTIQAWVNPDSLADLGSTRRMICTKSDVAGDGWYLNVATDGTVFFDSFPVSSKSTAAGVITTGSLQHIVVTSDDVTLKIYVDGVEEHSSAAPIPAASATPFQVGRWIANDLAMWDGVIDELAVWSRNLTPVEVASLYNAGSGKLLTDATGLPTTPTIVGNTIINMVPDNGNTLYSVVLNPTGIGEGGVGTLVANLVV